mgnify:CR=1 FL=1
MIGCLACRNFADLKIGMDQSQKVELQALSWPQKLSAVMELTKARLNLSVVYSAVAGYLLGASQIEWLSLLNLSLGGFLVVGAANGFNQVLERDRDVLMSRTQSRPLPQGRLSTLEAMIACTLMAVAGLTLLYFINPMTVLFGGLALFLYVLVYTPLKAWGPIAVFVGAFPGAIPALLGWVAATNDFDIEPGVLFAIQFLWQFSHFWAIAWIAHDDYQKAGYNLLPSGKRDVRSLAQILIYTVFVIPVSLLPYFGFTGQLGLSLTGMMLILALGIVFVYYAVNLAYRKEQRSARQLMLYSVIYLPVVQLIYVLDKFI